jgi:hypothetical protein
MGSNACARRGPKSLREHDTQGARDVGNALLDYAVEQDRGARPGEKLTMALSLRTESYAVNH